DILVTTQVALSLMLMIAGSLLVRSSLRSIDLPTGYESKHVIDLNFQFPKASKYTAAHQLVLVNELRARLAALPGVAEITSAQPPGGGFQTAVISLDGVKSSDLNAQAILPYTYVQANYFHTLGIPLLLGHGFQPPRGQPEHSVTVSESAARLLWPGRNPIGRRLRLGPIDERNHNRNELLANGSVYQIIGVARDKRGIQFDGSDSKEIYLPVSDDQLQGRPILIRTQSDPAQVIRVIDRVLSSIDPDMVATSSTLEEALHQSPPFLVASLAAAVASTIGFFGLLLASMGIYGTVSYIVVLRTREVGIRMAIGAQKHNVMGLILGESTRPVLAGLVAGMFLALGVSYLLRGVLYGLHAADAISFAAVSLLFLAIALVASYPPARRAMRVDPVIALRYE
ncbi:MAG: FtsX-like permease family protein, partial [Bryobacteraceae bacterium]